MEVITFIIQGIGKAFDVMSDYVILPGLSVLGLSLILLLFHTLFDIFWFGMKSYMSDRDIAHRASVAEEARIKTRNDVYSKQARERRERNHRK